MEEPFNPYHKWLGIPPEEQPANCYRLLGLQLYEPNADVIAGAADRTMAHVRSFLSGPQGPAAQEVLNQLEAARQGLLNPQQKAAYDGSLYQYFAAQQAAYQQALAQQAAQQAAMQQAAMQQAAAQQAAMPGAGQYPPAGYQQPAAYQPPGAGQPLAAGVDWQAESPLSDIAAAAARGRRRSRTRSQSPIPALLAVLVLAAAAGGVAYVFIKHKAEKGAQPAAATTNKDQPSQPDASTVRLPGVSGQWGGRPAQPPSAPGEKAAAADSKSEPAQPKPAADESKPAPPEPK